MALSALQLTGQSQSHIAWLNNNLGIHQEMLPAWQAMCHQAELEGFSLKIASGFRDFNRQLSIWNRKFSGELATKNEKNEIVNMSRLTDEEKVNAILLYSALPGTSRHHWGTDIDVYADNLLPENQTLQLEPWEYETNGPFALLSEWLQKQAKNFGFFFPYDIYRGGVAAEPWHLSYQPLASQCTAELNNEQLIAVINSADILGKKAIIKNIPDIMSQYVKNINSPL